MHKTIKKVNPPRKGSESYETYTKEKNAILSSLNRRSKKISQTLNQLNGISCTEIEGALYAFPTVTLPSNQINYIYIYIYNIIFTIHYLLFTNPSYNSQIVSI